MAPPDRGVCRLVPGAVKKDQCEEADVQYHRDLDDESKRICIQGIPCGPVIAERDRRPPPIIIPPPRIQRMQDIRPEWRRGGRKTVKRRSRHRRTTRRRRH